MTPEKKEKKKSRTGIPIARHRQIEEAEPEENLEEETEVAEENEDQEKLEELQQAFGGKQYYFRIERLNEQSNDMEIVDRVYLDNFDPFVLAKKYGGGRFVCSLLNEKGHYVKGGRFHFNFAKVQAEARPASPLQDPTMAMFIEQMKNQQAMLLEILKASMGTEKQTDIDKLLNGLKTLQDLNPKDKEPNTMKQLSEMIALQAQLKDLSGDDEKGSSIMSEVKEALKLLMEARGAVKPSMIPQQPRSARVLNTSNMPIVSPKEPVPVKQYSPAVNKILFYIPKFEEAAAVGASPEKWASFLVDILDNEVIPELVIQYHGFADEDGIWERLISSAQDEEKINKIFEVAPSLDAYRPWVLSVILAAIAQVSEDEVPEPMNGTQD